MDLPHIVTVLIVLTAVFAYINARFLKLPFTIGLMLISIVLSMLVMALGAYDPALLRYEQQLVQSIDFHELLMCDALHACWKMGIQSMRDIDWDVDSVPPDMACFALLAEPV